MNFHVGQKVVLVDDAWDSITLAKVSVLPVRGCVYTICGFHPLGNSIWLEEIVNPIEPGYPEDSFFCFRFRPIKTTDISIFTKMLAPTPKEREPA